MANLAQNHQKAKQAHRKGSAWRLLMTGILVVLLILGGILVFHSLSPKPVPFPTLCSGNFQSAHIAAVPTPATSTSPDGETIGLSEGATIFDLQDSNHYKVQDKLQAARSWVNNPQNVVPSLNEALKIDQTDAEAQIYRENWQVLTSNHPHFTLVVGVSFASNAVGASREALQGAYTAPKKSAMTGIGKMLVRR